MLVYILNKNGVPLMPSSRCGHIRKLLKEQKAVVVQRDPFTIRLLYDTPDIVQEVEFKEDTGYLHIGVSACSDKAELYSAEIKLNPDIKNKLQDRRRYRHTRRNHLRYRKPRFDNRRRKDNWLAPSIQHKVDSHIKAFESVKKILPVSKAVFEVGTFDTQKIKNPDISGTGYQEGELTDFRNLREYVFFRDNYTCQICGRNAFKDKAILHMHHREFWNNGNRANTPANGMTVCEKCHVPKNHQPGAVLWGIKADFKSLKPETYMSAVRWFILNEVRSRYPDMEVSATYGYLTKSRRIELGLEKSHANDAYCIGEKQPVKRAVDTRYYIQRSKNNRSLEKFYDAKYIDGRDGSTKTGKELSNGRTKRGVSGENLHPYRERKVKKGRVSIRKKHYALQPKDIVLWCNRRMTVVGVHNNGARVILDNKKSVALKNVKLIRHAKPTYLERSVG